MFNKIIDKIKRSLKQNIGSLILPHLPWQLCDFGFSGRVIIEPTNICNLKCPLCPVPNLKRKKGLLSLEDFKKIVDDIPNLKFINLGWAGEPLLNPAVLAMVEYANSRGIQTSLSTNTVFLNRYLEQIFNSGLTNLIVCLEGPTKEIHEKYRVGSNFESIKKNIKKFCQEKKKRKLKIPKVTLQCLLTKDLEPKIPIMIQLAKNLGVDSLSFKTLSLGSTVSLKEKIKRAKEFLPSAKFSRYVLKEENLFLKSKSKLCPWIRQSVILWNGDVTCCCYDMEGELVVGNIFREGSFKKIWKSEKYKKYRKKILKEEFNLCQNCSRTDEYSCTINFYD